MTEVDHNELRLTVDKIHESDGRQAEYLEVGSLWISFD